MPVESQTLVFTKTSLQAQSIGPRNPRAIYFNDTVAMGWIRGAQLLEVAVHDPAQGVIFYAIPQVPMIVPQFRRADATCLVCHRSEPTLDVPGLAISSVFPNDEGIPMSAPAHETTDHRTPMAERFGGWYATGKGPPAVHLARTPPPDLSLAGFASPHSDPAALMVLAHQAHMINLLTRLGWQTRIALADAGERGAAAAAQAAAREFVDYLLFVDEAPLPQPIAGSSAFPEVFAMRGPRDRKGRSLRDLDLATRLLRYPCSYMIYAPAFDALPPAARAAVFDRLWQVLSGRETDPKYARLTRTDRAAVLEILRDTKPGWPY